jgi:hypothetical protein
MGCLVGVKMRVASEIPRAISGPLFKFPTFDLTAMATRQATLSFNNNTQVLNTPIPKMTASIDSETLKQYLADSPPSVVPLTIKPHFEALTDKEKLYAHHISMYLRSLFPLT